MNQTIFLESKNGYFGEGELSFGGCFIPEVLYPALRDLQKAYQQIFRTKKFKKELKYFYKTFIGRPTPLIYAKNASLILNNEIYLKFEGLANTGAHKINNALAQVLLAKKMNKQHVIAETGAGQHGVAVASVCAFLKMPCTIFMGAVDVQRQRPNVFIMEQFGASVVSVESGTKTLKDAVNEALRQWSNDPKNSFYVLGSALGPYPYPDIVRESQKIIGKEIKKQVYKATRSLPDYVVACVGGGSNAIGAFSTFLKHEEVKLVGVEAGGDNFLQNKNAIRLAPNNFASIGIVQGYKSYFLQDNNGQIVNTHSISAGLDYAGVGPQLAHLSSIRRVEFMGVTDTQALEALQFFARHEGILPALESSHALAGAIEITKKVQNQIIVVNVSGRGDKDIFITAKELRTQEWRDFLASELECVEKMLKQKTSLAQKHIFENVEKSKQQTDELYNALKDIDHKDMKFLDLHHEDSELESHSNTSTSNQAHTTTQSLDTDSLSEEEIEHSLEKIEQESQMQRAKEDLEEEIESKKEELTLLEDSMLFDESVNMDLEEEIEKETQSLQNLEDSIATDSFSDAEDTFSPYHESSSLDSEDMLTQDSFNPKIENRETEDINPFNDNAESLEDSLLSDTQQEKTQENMQDSLKIQEDLEDFIHDTHETESQTSDESTQGEVNENTDDFALDSESLEEIDKEIEEEIEESLEENLEDFSTNAMDESQANTQSHAQDSINEANILESKQDNTNHTDALHFLETQDVSHKDMLQLHNRDSIAFLLGTSSQNDETTHSKKDLASHNTHNTEDSYATAETQETINTDSPAFNESETQEYNEDLQTQDDESSNAESLSLDDLESMQSQEDKLNANFSNQDDKENQPEFSTSFDEELGIQTNNEENLTSDISSETLSLDSKATLENDENLDIGDLQEQEEEIDFDFLGTDSTTDSSQTLENSNDEVDFLNTDSDISNIANEEKEVALQDDEIFTELENATDSDTLEDDLLKLHSDEKELGLHFEYESEDIQESDDPTKLTLEDAPSLYESTTNDSDSLDSLFESLDDDATTQNNPKDSESNEGEIDSLEFTFDSKESSNDSQKENDDSKNEDSKEVAKPNTSLNEDSKEALNFLHDERQNSRVFETDPQLSKICGKSIKS